MTSPRRRPWSAVGDPGRPVVRAILTVLALVVPVLGPALVLTPAATAADAGQESADLDVRIDTVSPTVLRTGSRIELGGSITNQGTERWRDAQVYLVMSRVPFQSRESLTSTIGAGQPYTGTRVVELPTIDEIGDLDPGDSVPFEVSVPYRELGLSDAPGVYPVGVQVLATDADGTRSADAVGRATTFLSRPGDGPAAPVGVVWPFLMPDRLTTAGTWADPERLVADVSDGRLRHLLDLARRAPEQATTVVVDPALLLGLDDLLDGRRLPAGLELDETTQQAVESFRTDLLDLATSTATWVLDFDRADLLALSRAGTSSGILEDAVRRATRVLTQRHDLTGRRVGWPSTGSLTRDVLERASREEGSALIASPRDLPGWRPDEGTVVRQESGATSVPVLVSDRIRLPGPESVVRLRQQLLAEATFASLSRERSDESAASGLVLVSPTWDPGAGADDPFDAVFDTRTAQPASAERLLEGRPRVLAEDVATSSRSRGLDVSQVRDVADALRTIGLLGEVVPESGGLEDQWALAAASTLGVRWRSAPGAGRARALAVEQRAETALGRLSIKGPPAFTLSSRRGSFPLTVTNGTRTTVAVGIRIDSTNPELAVDGLRDVRIGPGERRTVDVAVDVGSQTSATLSASLVSPTGRTIGEPAVFNIRSSQVGLTVWIALGVAAVVVALLVARQVVRRRGSAPESSTQDQAAEPARTEDLDG